MKNTKVSFAKQTIYIGIDVHKKQWTVTILHGDIKTKAFSMDPSPQQLIRHLKTNYPGATYKSVYEAGFSGFWAHRELVRHGVENIVVSPGDVPTRNSERQRKTDKRDSMKLARELSKGNLEAIYVPQIEEEAFRSMVRLLYKLTQERKRMKSRIKSLLNGLGVKLPKEHEKGRWNVRLIEYLQVLPLVHEYFEITLREMLAVLLAKIAEISRLKNRIAEIVKSKEETAKEIEIIQSVPGIGEVISLALYSEMIDMKRFQTLDNLASYVGIIPSMHSSGERERTRGMVRQHNRYMRNLLIQAAWRAVRVDPAMQSAYGHLVQVERKNTKQAIIRIAKKLLNRLRSVWLSGKKYQKSVVREPGKEDVKGKGKDKVKRIELKRANPKMQQETDKSRTKNAAKTSKK